MKRIAVIVLVGLSAVFTSCAEAHTTIVEPPGSHFPYQQWVDESAMPTPDVTIEVIETGSDRGCPGQEMNYAGCTDPEEGKIWLAPEDIGATFPRHFLYHELGHNVDADTLPEWMRERFSEIIGAGPIWDLEGEPTRYGPNEKFADAWAQCAWRPYIRPRLPWLSNQRYVWQEEPVGGVRGHDRICRMLGKL